MDGRLDAIGVVSLVVLAIAAVVAVVGSSTSTAPPATAPEKPVVVAPPVVTPPASIEEPGRLPSVVVFSSAPHRLEALRLVTQLRQQYSGRLDVSMIDVDEHPDVAKLWGVEAAPQVYVFDRKGKLLQKFSIGLNLVKLLQALRDLHILPATPLINR